jgi:hypothetical protein
MIRIFLFFWWSEDALLLALELLLSLYLQRFLACFLDILRVTYRRVLCPETESSLQRPFP